MIRFTSVNTAPAVGATFTAPAILNSMIIEWSNEDEAYIVTVPELPGCRTHGSTYEEAVQQGQDAIESWIMAAQADNDPIPTPKRYIAA